MRIELLETARVLTTNDGPCVGLQLQTAFSYTPIHVHNFGLVVVPFSLVHHTFGELHVNGEGGTLRNCTRLDNNE